MQTLGGFGYAKEYDVERYWSESRLMKIAPISQEMILNYVVRARARLAPLVLTRATGSHRQRLRLLRRSVCVPRGHAGRRRSGRRPDRRLPRRADDADPVEGAATKSRARVRDDVPDPGGGDPRNMPRARGEDRQQRRRAEPAGLGAAASPDCAARLGLHPRIGVVDGDDVRDWFDDDDDGHGQRLPRLGGASPNASRAEPTSWSPVESPTPRSSSARRRGGTVGSRLRLGPARWRVVAGHVIECGAQATGGNYSFLDELDSTTTRSLPRLPDRRGRRRWDRRSSPSSPAPAALVTVGTVTAQLLYEIDAPAYVEPGRRRPLRHDRTRRGRRPRPRRHQRRARRATAADAEGGDQHSRRLAQLDDVRAHGPRHRAQGTARSTMLAEVLGGFEQFAEHASSWSAATTPTRPRMRRRHAQLRVTVKDADRDRVDRRFSAGVTELMLASYPGRVSHQLPRRRPPSSASTARLTSTPQMSSTPCHPSRRHEAASFPIRQ